MSSTRFPPVMLMVLIMVATSGLCLAQDGWEDNDGPVQAGQYAVDCTPGCCRRDYCADLLSVEVINNWDRQIKQATIRVIITDYDRDAIVYDELHKVDIRVSPNESRPTEYFRLKKKVVAPNMVFVIAVVGAK